MKQVEGESKASLDYHLVDGQNIEHINKEIILYEEKTKSKEIKIKTSNFSSKRERKQRKKKESKRRTSKKLQREKEKAKKHLLTSGNFEFHEE